MKSWNYKSENYELEINVFKDVYVCIYKNLKERSFQVRCIKKDDRPVFPSDEEEIELFTKTHFFKIL